MKTPDNWIFLNPKIYRFKEKNVEEGRLSEWSWKAAEIQQKQKKKSSVSCVTVFRFHGNWGWIGKNGLSALQWQRLITVIL